MNTHILKFKALMLVMVLMSFVCCKKEDKPESINPGMSFLVNNTAKDITGDENVVALLDEGRISLEIKGNLRSTIENVSIELSDFRGKGNYIIGTNAEAIYSNGSIPLENNYLAESGSINITTFTKTGVKGTFQFYSTNSLGAFKNITEGKFEANVIKQ